MELQSFITQAITDIINGVKDAQNQTAEGSVVPAGAGGDWERSLGLASSVIFLKLKLEMNLRKQINTLQH